MKNINKFLSVRDLLPVADRSDETECGEPSSDSEFREHLVCALFVHGGYGVMDFVIQGLGGVEGLMGQEMLFEVAPAVFHVVEFGGVLGQPLRGEPRTRGERGGRGLAGVDGTVSITMTTGLSAPPGRGPYTSSRRSRSAMKSVLCLVVLVSTNIRRRAESNTPRIARRLAWPGAGIRKSAPGLAQT